MLFSNKLNKKKYLVLSTRLFLCFTHSSQFYELKKINNQNEQECVCDKNNHVNSIFVPETVLYSNMKMFIFKVGIKILI